jgi:hypothetical protein
MPMAIAIEYKPVEIPFEDLLHEVPPTINGTDDGDR